MSDLAMAVLRDNLQRGLDMRDCVYEEDGGMHVRIYEDACHHRDERTVRQKKEFDQHHKKQLKRIITFVVFYFGFLIYALVSFYGCQTVTQPAVLPPVGEVVYCPHCDTNLYLRVTGTSRTRFDRADWFPLFFDIPVPAVGDEMVCPRCADIIVDYSYSASSHHIVVTRVYSRAFVEREEPRIEDIQTPEDAAPAEFGDFIQRPASDTTVVRQ